MSLEKVNIKHTDIQELIVNIYMVCEEHTGHESVEQEVTCLSLGGWKRFSKKVAFKLRPKCIENSLGNRRWRRDVEVYPR